MISSTVNFAHVRVGMTQPYSQCTIKNHLYSLAIFSSFCRTVFFSSRHRVFSAVLRQASSFHRLHTGIAKNVNPSDCQRSDLPEAPCLRHAARRRTRCRRVYCRACPAPLPAIPLPEKPDERPKNELANAFSLRPFRAVDSYAYTIRHVLVKAFGLAAPRTRKTDGKYSISMFR